MYCKVPNNHGVQKRVGGTKASKTDKRVGVFMYRYVVQVRRVGWTKFWKIDKRAAPPNIVRS